MLPRSAYVEIAKKAIQGHSKHLYLRRFSDPIVTHRLYRNAPAADHDMVAVQFVWEGDLSGGGLISGSMIVNREAPPVPVVQALIRKNGSKVYLNMLHYKHG